MILRLPHPLAIATATTVVILVGYAVAAPAAEVVSGKTSDGLVFVAEKEGELDLWRARLSDGALQQLTMVAGREERWPDWSDEAQRLLMITRNTDGAMTTNIALLDPVTGEESGLGPVPDYLQRFPIWSPDGKSVAHTFRMPHISSNSGTDSGVAIVKPGKRNRDVVSRVEKSGHRMLHLSYSNDGRFIIAKGRAPDVKAHDELFLLRPGVDPMAIPRVPSGTLSKPRFTRDDKNIVFTYRLRPERGRSIMMLAYEGNAVPARIASSPRADDHSAMPSPTRDEIVFVSNRDGSHDVFIAPLDGGDPVNLTLGKKTADTSPVWSPDGERIAYVAMPEHLFETTDKDYSTNTIRVIDRKGKLLFETKGMMPDWMPAWAGDQPVAPGAKPTPKDEP